MGLFSWSYHGLCLKRVESGWREGWGRDWVVVVVGWLKQRIPAEEAPV